MSTTPLSPTPNDIAPETISPSLLRRFAAMAYDTLLLMAVSILYGAVVVGINLLIMGIPETGQRVTFGALNSLVFVGWIVTLAGFFCYFWHKSGQTLGMKTWKIRVLDEGTRRYPSYQQCIIRCLIAPVSLLLFGFGYWFMYLNPNRQSLHDKLSRTKLVSPNTKSTETAKTTPL